MKTHLQAREFSILICKEMGREFSQEKHCWTTSQVRSDSPVIKILQTQAKLDWLVPLTSSFILFYFIFKLYIIVLVLPNIKMNPPQVYMCSPSWTLHPPPSPYHPSGSSQCTSPKHPASCIEPGLATRFIHDILHVSMPFSQIFPPSPSPTESIRLYRLIVQIQHLLPPLVQHF